MFILLAWLQYLGCVVLCGGHEEGGLLASEVLLSAIELMRNVLLTTITDNVENEEKVEKRGENIGRNNFLIPQIFKEKKFDLNTNNKNEINEKHKKDKFERNRSLADIEFFQNSSGTSGLSGKKNKILVFCFYYFFSFYFSFSFSNSVIL